MKRYGCVYTCFTTRAIHLEVLNSFKADKFINEVGRSKVGYDTHPNYDLTMGKILTIGRIMVVTINASVWMLMRFFTQHFVLLRLLWIADPLPSAAVTSMMIRHYQQIIFCWWNLILHPHGETFMMMTNTEKLDAGLTLFHNMFWKFWNAWSSFGHGWVFATRTMPFRLSWIK